MILLMIFGCARAFAESCATDEADRLDDRYMIDCVDDAADVGCRHFEPSQGFRAAVAAFARCEFDQEKGEKRVAYAASLFNAVDMGKVAFSVNLDAALLEWIQHRLSLSR